MFKHGIVVAVCISSRGGVPKYAQQEAEVGQYGLAGDIHAGPTRTSRSTHQPKFNDRQISLVSSEVLDDLNKELGINLKPGFLAENITTQGLGDLSSIQDGVLLKIGKSVIIEVTEQNVPCKNLLVYHRLLVKKINGRRGLLAIIRNGVGTKIKTGDIIEIL